MAHRMRLSTVVIDCQTEDLATALPFWSGLLGVEGEIDARGKYAEMGGYRGNPKILLQAVDHAPRVHLDFETDDIEAEVARLKGLGAREVERVRDWVVMEAPTGQRFCIVPPQGEDFPGDAKEFEG